MNTDNECAELEFLFFSMSRPGLSSSKFHHFHRTRRPYSTRNVVLSQTFVRPLQIRAPVISLRNSIPKLAFYVCLYILYVCARVLGCVLYRVKSATGLFTFNDGKSS